MGIGVHSRVEVELDVFSGRPNPTWVLSVADAAYFLDKLASLPPVGAGQIENPLGYRGFVVDTGRGEVGRVQKGTVEVAGGERRSYFADPSRELERWLFNRAATEIDSDLAALVEAELGRHGQSEVS